jgi:hypothetical protein
MNVTVLDELALHEVSVLDTEIYNIVLSDSNFITVADDDIMEVTVVDGVCC